MTLSTWEQVTLLDALTEWRELAARRYRLHAVEIRLMVRSHVRLVLK